MGYDIAYEDKAVAFTEAPDNLRSFIRQRFRWTYGTLQSVWKHRNTFFRRRYGSLGSVALPNIVIFQLLFPLISPLMDLLVVVSVALYYWQRYYHGSSSGCGLSVLRPRVRLGEEGRLEIASMAVLAALPVSAGNVLHRDEVADCRDSREGSSVGQS
jgi:hypothetical protein